MSDIVASFATPADARLAVKAVNSVAVFAAGLERVAAGFSVPVLDERGVYQPDHQRDQYLAAAARRDVLEAENARLRARVAELERERATPPP